MTAGKARLVELDYEIGKLQDYTFLNKKLSFWVSTKFLKNWS